MSLNTNITNLRELLDKVNALPNTENLEDELNSQSALISEQNAKIAELADVLANKANGGSTLKTCTVTVNIDESYAILGVRVENGIPVPFYSEDIPQNRTWETVCGSIVVVSSQWLVDYDCTNATFIKEGFDYTSGGTMFGYNRVKIFHIDAKEGETAIIDIWEV